MNRTFVVAAAIAAAASIAGAPAANADGKYANCTEAHQDGRYDIPQSDPDYWPGGDRDKDGFACDS
jgi:hypothetical protein